MGPFPRHLPGPECGASGYTRLEWYLGYTTHHLGYIHHRDLGGTTDEGIYTTGTYGVIYHSPGSKGTSGYTKMELIHGGWCTSVKITDVPPTGTVKVVDRKEQRFGPWSQRKFSNEG